MLNSGLSSKTKRTTKKELAVGLGISRGMLYYSHKQDVKDERSKEAVISVLAANPFYGHKRVGLALGWGKNKAKRIMVKYGLKPKRRKKHFTKPNDLGRLDNEISNLIKNLCPIRSNVVWVGDFTYLNFHGKFYYLSTAMDLFTREILGWNFSDHHNAELVIAAFNDAKQKQKTTPAYCHSDKGSEYDSYKYKTLIRSHNTLVSMSKKGSPWENGYQESWYSHYKEELGDIDRFQTLGELVEAIALQIHYYNHDRIHTSLKTSPVKFRLNLTVQSVFKETGT
jgi:transposase InsO family protein